MLITCPVCRQKVDVGSRKPGRYRGTCLSCSSSFGVVVPASPATPVRILVSPAVLNGFAQPASRTTLPKSVGRVVDCPACDQPIDLGRPPAGRYQASCPECKRNIGTVAAEANGRVQLLPAPAPHVVAHRRSDFPSVPRPAPKPLPPTLRRPYLPEEDDPPAKPLPPTLRRPYFEEDEDETAGGDGAGQTPPVPTSGLTSANGSRSPKALAPDSISLEHDSDPEGWEDDFSPAGKPALEATAAGANTGDDFSLGGEVTEPGEESPDGVPSRLGGYEVIKVLGQGGMGSVLLGRQISLDRKVAIKVMHPKIAQNPSFVARFTREAFAAAQLTHHNVVQIYDIGEQKGQHFFSMEFVRGRNLTDVVRATGPLAAEVAAGYALQAARGLRSGHAQGMVHRDVKPANLLLNEDGVVKVADLGLVKFSADEAGAAGAPAAAGTAPASPHLTAAGTAVGTPAFMAPEQAANSSDVDERADVYSLGCTLYALVTGRPPFAGTTALEVMTRHLTEPVVPPEAVAKRVPQGLSAIVQRMLAKSPADRYQSMDEVIAALEGFLGVRRAESFSPREEDADQLEGLVADFRSRSRENRKRGLAAGFALVCLAGVVAAAVAGRPVAALAAVGLLFTTPLAYFVARGGLSGGVVFTRARALVLGMKVTDWVIAAGVSALLGGAVFLFGLLWAGLGVLFLSGGLGFALWYATDRPQAAAQRDPLDGIRTLCRRFRLQGLNEDQVREFVSKFGGPDWEPPFEALFGYEALLAARTSRGAVAGDAWHRHAAWRDPIVAWADARLEARRQSRERDLLRKVEAKALEAEGLTRTEAEDQAAELAVAMVDQASAAKKARREGKPVDIRGVVKAARSRKRHPSYANAAKKLRTLWLRTLLDEWFGRWARFVLGAALFTAGLLWMHQNQLLGGSNPVLQEMMAGNLTGPTGALTLLGQTPGRALSLPLIPGEVTALVDSYRVVLAGAMVLVSGLFFYGWRSTVPAVLGVALALFGKELDLPAAGPLTPALTGLVIGAALILPLGWLLRK